MKKELQISIFRTALTVSLFLGLFTAISFTVYGQANAIRSNYIQLTGGGGTSMVHMGNPTGVGGFPHSNSACGGEFRYNYGSSNRFIIFTGVAVPNVSNPDQTNRDHFHIPTMTQNNPNAGPSGTAFTVGNVSSPSVTTSGIFTNFTYHDLINSAIGFPAPDGVADGYTGIANLNGFRIEHSAFILLNPIPNTAGINVPDETDFLFTITNTSAQARVFGLSWNVDTQIGYGGAVTW